MMSILRQMDRTLVELMNRENDTQYQIYFLFSRVAFAENCVRYPCFLSRSELFRLDIPGKTNF